MRPKGFKRSDERLKDDIAERLMYRDDVDSSDVSLEVKDGKVTLEGTVPVRWMRYVVDDIAESVMGVEDVENNVRVRRFGGSLSDGATPEPRGVETHIADADKKARTGSEDEAVRNTPPAGAWNDVA